MRFVAGILGAAAGWLVVPASASAHGLTGRADLPIPTWLFSWAAALVLVASFVALATLWQTPQLEGDRWRPLPPALSRVLTSRVVDVLCGAIGVALLGLVFWAGFWGSEVVTDNIAPTFVYVVFWLGLVPLSVLFGDVFRAFNPWRAVGRLVGRLAGSGVPSALPYPERLGHWPAALGLLAFAWLELVSSDGDAPSTVAAATAVYSVVTWIGMATYGVEAWTRRACAFSVYFGLYARLSPVERRDGALGLRRPLSGLARLDPGSGLIAVVIVMIGTVSFDGLSAGPSWPDWIRPLLDFLRDTVGLSAKPALELSYGIGMVVVVALVGLLYRLAILGAHTVDRQHSAGELARRFAPSLVPIALAYAAAHYVSLLLFQGQGLAALASNPLGRDWDWLGTADWTIDYGFIGAETFWYIQLAFVLLGHLAALALAHDRALVIYRQMRLATRSQYWMLAVMIAFTSIALWLLSEASKG